MIKLKDLLKEYAEDKDENYDMTVYMPLGVLSFILSTEELTELMNNTDQKFWNGVAGWYNYRFEYTKMHGYSMVELKKAAYLDHRELSFKEDD